MYIQRMSDGIIKLKSIVTGRYKRNSMELLRGIAHNLN